MGIHLVSVVGGPACAGVLPHMLKHYLSLGVDSVILNAHATTRDEQALAEAEEIAGRFGIRLQSVVIGPWSQGINPMLYGVSRLSRPDEWFVMADQDELQVYPDELKSIVEFCDRRGYNYIEGCFVDRVAEGGRLEAVEQQRPIWEQYPIGCVISAKLLRANPNKIVAAKGSVRVWSGQHKALSGVGCSPLECYVPVHHFKWVAGVERSLANRIALFKHLKEPFWEESCRFLEHLRAHGVIDLDNPSIRAARCEPKYPFWQTLVDERLINPRAGRIPLMNRPPFGPLVEKRNPS